MKKLCVVFLILVWGIYGCSDSVGPTSNAPPNQEESLSKQPNWLKPPAPKNKSLAKTITVEEPVDNKGGILHLKDEFETVDGEFKVDIKLKFGKDCVEEKVNISLTFDRETGIVTVLPHMKLKKPAELNVYQEGFDFESVNPDEIGFIHYNEDGTQYFLNKFRIKIYIDKKACDLMKGEPEEFSRFGFGLSI